jgi:hypothetical protein
MSPQSLCRFGLSASLLVLSVVSSGSKGPRIVPLRTSAIFTAQSRGKVWSVPIKRSDGHVAYVLSLEPEPDVENHVVVAQLVLRRVGSKPDADNLLQPSGRWRGLQAYYFAANDLAHGAKDSAFGQTRTLSLAKLGLLVRVTITDAKVSLISADDYKLEILGLQIECENL